MSGWRNDLSRLLIALTALAVLAGCSKRATPAEEAGESGTLLLSQRNEPSTLDPHLATLPDEFFVIRALGEGLVAPSPDGGQPLPAAAERWSVSPDGLVWTFILREAAWSNGDPVDAHDFVWSFRRALNPALAAPKAHLFYALKNAAAFNRGDILDPELIGVSAPNRRTLVVTLEHPAVDLLALAASGTWIPVHPPTVEAAGGAAARNRVWTRPHNYVGNGPFNLQRWRPNQDITVGKNAGYWDAASVRFDRVVFLAFDNGDAEERAFRAGSVHVTMAVPASKLDTHRAARPPVLRSVPLHETRYLALNTTRPPLDDLRVRRALSLALDRDTLVKLVLRGGQRAAYSFIPPGLGGYSPGTKLDEDAARARELLAEAGFPGGNGFPRLELTAWNVTPAILEVLQQSWKRELGIEVAIVQREAKTHIAALAAGDFEIGFMTAIPDYDAAADLFDDLVGGNSSNYSRWQDAGYDRLIGEARRSGNAAIRLGLYREAESVMLDALPIIPVYFNSKNLLVHPSIRDWREDALWTRFFKNTHWHEN